MTITSQPDPTKSADCVTMDAATKKERIIPARPLGCLGLIVGLVVLAVLLGWVLLRFSTPTPEMFSAGEVKDYPPGQPPRLFSSESDFFYVLNNEGELIAMVARAKERLGSCLVHWSAIENAFIDPCLGTHISRDGTYLGKGPPYNLRHLPIKIKDNLVWVDLGYR